MYKRSPFISSSCSSCDFWSFFIDINVVGDRRARAVRDNDPHQIGTVALTSKASHFTTATTNRAQLRIYLKWNLCQWCWLCDRFLLCGARLFVGVDVRGKMSKMRRFLHRFVADASEKGVRDISRASLPITYTKRCCLVVSKCSSCYSLWFSTTLGIVGGDLLILA